MDSNPTPVKKVSKVKIRNLCLELKEPSIEWRDQAKCLGRDPGLFVYSSDEPTEKLRRELTEICKQCKVVLDCRIDGLRTLSEGWWGGMTPQERLDWAASHLFSDQLQ